MSSFFKKYRTHTGLFIFLRAELDPKILVSGNEGAVSFEQLILVTESLRSGGLTPTTKGCLVKFELQTTAASNFLA